MSDWKITEQRCGGQLAYRVQSGSWFAVVDSERMRYAVQAIADGDGRKVIVEHLVGEPDIGGIFDCSDESILIRAGLMADEQAEEEAGRLEIEEARHIRHLNHCYEQSSGVFSR